MRFDNKEVEFSINFANEMINSTGKLSPMAVGIAGNKKHVVPCMWSSDEEKMRYVKKAKELFKKVGVTEIVFMSEAWMKKVDKDDFTSEEDLPRPSLCPDRIECVIVTYLSRNEQVSAYMEMHRDGDRVSLGKPNIMVGNESKDNLWGDYFKEYYNV